MSNRRTRISFLAAAILVGLALFGLLAGGPAHEGSHLPAMADSEVGDPKTAVSSHDGIAQPNHPEETLAETAKLPEEPEPLPHADPQQKPLTVAETLRVPVNNDPSDDNPASTSETRIGGRLVMLRSHRGVVRDGPFYAWHESGALSATGSYKNDLRDGMWFYHYENGQISRTGSYVNDLEDGVWVHYRENGTIARRETYRAGKLHGRCEEYGEDGQLLDSNEYESGTKLTK